MTPKLHDSSSVSLSHHWHHAYAEAQTQFIKGPEVTLEAAHPTGISCVILSTVYSMKALAGAARARQGEKPL